MNEISYKQRRSGITYEQELEILAEVYRLALESYRKRKQEPNERSLAPSDRDAESFTCQEEVDMT